LPPEPSGHHQNSAIARVIPAEQYCKGAPWVIKQQDIENQPRAKTKRKGPSSSNPDQQTLIFSIM
jgi:hypothetical protein